MRCKQRITKWQAVQHVTDATKVANGIGYRTPTDFTVQVTPMSQRAVFERLGVELDQPYLVMGKIGDADEFKTGDLVSFDSLLYIIQGPVEKWNVGGVTDHFSFVMQRQQFQFTEPT